MGVIRWAWASLAANIAIVLTGGLVRLTDSGLGCPTWPRCTEDSFVPHRALGVHGAIEFGNRMFTYLLVTVAVGTLLAVWRSPSSRAERPLAVALAAGITLQGVIGGLTVLTNLNPWLVSLHLVLSMALIAGATVLVIRTGGSAPVAASARKRAVALAIGLLVILVVYLGTIVTGSGPHAGDAAAPRNGLDPELLSHLHAYAVWTLVALTLVAATMQVRFARPLLAVEAGQAALGVAQYELGLPIALVAAHLLGAAMLVAVTTALVSGYLMKGSAAAATNNNAR